MKRALALLALIASLQARAESPAVVQRMADAADRLNYRGILVQIEGNFTQSLSVLHRAGAQGGDDRVHSLQGDYWELQRKAQHCRVGLSGPSTVRDDALIAAMFPSVYPGRLLQTASYFDFERVGSGRLAGRDVDFILARPRDQFRFARLFATDVATGLLMKTSLLDARGRELRQAYFVDIEILDELPLQQWDAQVAAVPAGLQWSEYTLDPRPLDKPIPWQVDLPPGFAVVGYARGPVRAGGPPIEQLTISNGLTSLSVFIDGAAGGGAGGEGFSTIDALNAYVTTVGSKQVTLIGPVPNVTLEAVAKGLAPAGDGAQGQGAQQAEVSAGAAH
jgi:sigma-E factor negative regulatory protein RseB